MAIPKLNYLFHGMLRNLRFGIVVWAIHTATGVLWLINYFYEHSLWGMDQVPERPGLLSIIALSLLNLVALFYLQTRVSSSFRDYNLRSKMMAVSPTLGDVYSTIRPLMQALEGLFNRTAQAFTFVFVASLIGALSYSVLLVGTVIEISLLANVGGGIAVIAGDAHIGLFWIKRLLFYGVNSVLLWIFVIWAGVSFLKTYRIYGYLAGDYETEILPARIRELAEELESGKHE